MLDQDKTKEQLIAELHNLEKLFEARTAELTALKNQLQQEIEQHKAIEENLKLSEGSFVQLLRLPMMQLLRLIIRGLLLPGIPQPPASMDTQQRRWSVNLSLILFQNALLIPISIRRRKLFRLPRSLNQPEWQILQDSKRMALNFLLSFQYHSGSLLLAHVLQQ